MYGSSAHDNVIISKLVIAYIGRGLSIHLIGRSKVSKPSTRKVAMKLRRSQMQKEKNIVGNQIPGSNIIQLPLQNLVLMEVAKCVVGIFIK